GRETGQKGAECGIGRVRARPAWLAGAAGAAIAVYRKLRPEPSSAPADDPRAEQVRRKPGEARAGAQEQHEEAASPEIPVDEADVESRRAAVHERARASA